MKSSSKCHAVCEYLRLKSEQSAPKSISVYVGEMYIFWLNLMPNFQFYGLPNKFFH